MKNATSAQYSTVHELEAEIAQWVGWVHVREKQQTVKGEDGVESVVTTPEYWMIKNVPGTEVRNNPTKYCTIRELLYPLLEKVPQRDQKDMLHYILCRTVWLHDPASNEVEKQWAVLTAPQQVVAEALVEWIRSRRRLTQTQ